MKREEGERGRRYQIPRQMGFLSPFQSLRGGINIIMNLA